ncbi:type II toxin-antitoxin system VapC family toxin [Ammonicoccus fulvus]|uniref:Type II toxin-antitoxin system VapC family toxin n=1 Tax=Ammonicoccus fulvus TaxID=3138240 RepID=A0ABZ3FSM7_9ACTN
MTYLLDTHVFLWLLSEPDRVPQDVRDVLDDPANPLAISAVSALEVATKVRLGKLNAPGLIDTWSQRVATMGAEPLSITTDHALLAGRLAWTHRDPFDRLLVAQAMAEGMSLVTVDSAIAHLPAPAVVTW